MPLNRREFVGLTASAALAASPTLPALADSAPAAANPAGAAAPVHPLWAETVAKFDQEPFLTPQNKFRNVERGNPLPYKLPPEKRLEVGLERETWRLEVLADPAEGDQQIRPSKLERPFSKAAGTAFTFEDLMKLAETKAVRYLKIVACNNVGPPLGLALWEGVPLRDVLWLARPTENYRQVYYDGYHNDDPKQIFQCWLPANRVFEDPPSFLPVILCYKINGEWLTGERGGPVRMIVPEAYGFKSVKWLQRIVVTNRYQAEDTYALQNNDVNDSWLKTRASFLTVPGSAQAGSPFAITGLAQVGMSGLAKVQWWAQPLDQPWPTDDPHFATAPWQDAALLPLPESWRGGADLGSLHPAQFDPAAGQPREWPLRYTWCRWAAIVPGLAEGKHMLRCRTIDAAGHAQPLPRPYAKSGKNDLERREIIVQA